ncbi:MAG: O-antigen ligase family protein [Bdellovibrionales bacterium]
MAIVSSYINRFIVLLLFFSLPSSIAGLELSCFLATVVFAIHYLNALFNREAVGFFKKNSTGFDIVIGIFSFWIIASTLGIDTLPWDTKIYIFGELRWVIGLYSFIHIFRLEKSFLLRHIRVFYFVFSTIALLSIINFFLGVNLLSYTGKLVDHHGLIGQFLRSKGLFSNTMTFTYTFGFFLFVVMADLLVLQSKGIKNKIVFFYVSICFSTILLSIALSFTVGFWIAGLMGGFAILLKFYRPRVLVLSALGMLLILGSIFSSNGLREGMDSVYAVKKKSVSQRFQSWKAYLEISGKNPFLGVGHRQLSSHLENYYKEKK